MMGRVIFSRHRRYGFYRPSAVTVASTLADLPNYAAQILVFDVRCSRSLSIAGWGIQADEQEPCRSSCTLWEDSIAVPEPSSP